LKSPQNKLKTDPENTTNDDRNPQKTPKQQHCELAAKLAVIT